MYSEHIVILVSSHPVVVII